MNHGEVTDSNGPCEGGSSTHVALPVSDSGQVAPAPTAIAGEKWYLKIDDTEFGPVTRSQLEYFLQPPRLCSVLQVMCSTQDGSWHLIARHETIDKVLSRFGFDHIPSSLPEPLSDDSSARNARFIERICDVYRAMKSGLLKYNVEWSLVVVMVGINVSYLYITSDGLARERQILRRFESTWELALQFDPDDESKDEWREFADNAIVELETLIEELRKSRRSSPEQQLLILIGREQLLVALQEPTPAITGSKLADDLNSQLRQIHEILLQKQ